MTVRLIGFTVRFNFMWKRLKRKMFFLISFSLKITWIIYIFKDKKTKKHFFTAALHCFIETEFRVQEEKYPLSCQHKTIHHALPFKSIKHQCEKPFKCSFYHDVSNLLFVLGEFAHRYKKKLLRGLTVSSSCHLYTSNIFFLFSSY